MRCHDTSVWWWLPRKEVPWLTKYSKQYMSISMQGMIVVQHGQLLQCEALLKTPVWEFYDPLANSGQEERERGGNK